MTDTTYNGWTNYETWAVNLWWDNDEYLCNDLKPDLARSAWSGAEAGQFWTREEGAANVLADRIRVHVENPENGIIPDLGATLAADLMGAALSEVNWREIATNWLGDLSEADRAEIDV